MLKVVGASWEKTRLTYILLSFVIIIAFFAVFFLEMPIKHEDGMYAATVVWSAKIGFKVEFWGQNNKPEKIARGAARAYYKPDTHTTGWASIEIETNSHYPDWVQAYSAGLLEGSLCWQLIYWHWQNTVEASCGSSDSEACNEIREYLKDVEESAQVHARKSEEKEPFWHHVRLFYYQLTGLEEGWHIGVHRSRKQKQINIEHVDFLWMNSINEIRDLKLKYRSSDSPVSKQYSSLSFIKYLPNSTHQYLLAHQTGSSYSEMLRMHKKYKFNYHETSEQDSRLAPVQTVTFTSYPGAIHSQDDYYQVYIDERKHLTIAGSNIHMSRSLIKDSKPQYKVPPGPTAMAACRLSCTGSDWAHHVNKEGGSNIGGKQWLVMETSPQNLSFWLIEQTPQLVKTADKTAEFQKKGYWISAGIPHSKEVLGVMGINTTPDSKLNTAIEFLKENHENASSMGSLFELMHTPELIALGRADIIQYKSEAYLPAHGGVIDIKIADADGDQLAVAGPPYSKEVEPFQWSRSILQELPHHGQPDIWKYGPVKPVWVW